MTGARGALLPGELREEDSSEVELEPEVKVGVIAWKNEFHINGTKEKGIHTSTTYGAGSELASSFPWLSGSGSRSSASSESGLLKIQLATVEFWLKPSSRALSRTDARTTLELRCEFPSLALVGRRWTCRDSDAMKGGNEVERSGASACGAWERMSALPR